MFNCKLLSLFFYLEYFSLFYPCKQAEENAIDKSPKKYFLPGTCVAIERYNNLYIILEF